MAHAARWILVHQLLMFNDWDGAENRTRRQIERLNQWRDRTGRPVAIETGAVDTVATVRAFAEGLGAPLIRIKPRQCRVPRANAPLVPSERWRDVFPRFRGVALLVSDLGSRL